MSATINTGFATVVQGLNLRIHKKRIRASPAVVLA